MGRLNYNVVNCWTLSMFWFCGILVLVVGLAENANGQLKSNEDVCQLPEGGTGTCIQVRKCKPVVDFLEKATQPLSPLAIKQLKSYQCGFEGRDPKVCCPLKSDKVLNNETAEAPDVSNHRNLHLLPKNCGYLDTDNPNTNAGMTRIFEFPWMALLDYNNGTGHDFKCGGTIINDHYILTAAHCTINIPRYTLAGVRIGEHDIRTEQDCEEQAGEEVCAPKVQDVNIQEIIPHPQYTKSPNINNDIALLRVDRMNLTFENARPVCLPLGSARNFNFTDKNAVATGWGKTESARSSSVLLVAELPIIDSKECRKTFAKHNVNINYRQLCAGGRHGMDTCAGDSGGPLHVVDLVNDEMRYVQQAITSFGTSKCGSDGIPGVYTRVAHYMDWILDTIKP